MDTIIQLLRRYAPVITVAALVLLVVVVGLFCYKMAYTKKLQEPVILNQTVAKNPQKLADTLKITPKEATEVIAYKETAQPVATYYTQAPTLHDAAVVTKNAIKDKSPNIPKEAIEKSDRTAVVENDETQKVDVYKINLDKPHSILAGATVMNNGEIYETIGYEDKRIQGLAHFKGTEFKGASALVKVVRW
jgi:hypothetical protein